LCPRIKYERKGGCLNHPGDQEVNENEMSLDGFRKRGGQEDNGDSKMPSKYLQEHEAGN